MTRTVYLNGEFIPADQAKISIFDRAVNFGDAIYEVAGVLDGKLVDFEHHMQRYFNSLAKMEIESPLSQDQILAAFRQLVLENNLHQGLVYMQVTRGVAERNFVWPAEMKPTVFMFTQPKDSVEDDAVSTGVSLASVDDIRWARRDIKSVNLLAQVLAKKQAHDAGAYEALMIDTQGCITECGSMSFFMVKGDLILTRELTNDILPGVTRRAVIALCNRHGLQLVETRFTLDEVLAADEVFISGASSYVLPVTSVDNQPVGTGQPGETFKRLSEIYLEYARASLI